MHIEVLRVVQQIHAQLFCFEELDDGVVLRHLLREHLGRSVSVVTLREGEFPTLWNTARESRHVFPYGAKVILFPPLPLAVSPDQSWREFGGGVRSTVKSHGHRLPTRVYGRPPIEQLLDGLLRIQPDEVCCSSSCPEQLSILGSPFPQNRRHVVLHLNEGVVDEGPRRDHWR